jgi:hypothetical protein
MIDSSHDQILKILKKTKIYNKSKTFARIYSGCSWLGQ